MTSFKKILQEKTVERNNSMAYCMGASDYYSGQLYKLFKSPFEPFSKEDEEWQDGYMDAFFLSNGVASNEQ